MLTHPILINRPFVVTPMGARLARPFERVLHILPETHNGTSAKDDGEGVHDVEANASFDTPAGGIGRSSAAKS